MSEPSKLTILINTQAIRNGCSEKEYPHALKEVIAHEMAHIYLGHTNLFKNLLLFFGAPLAIALIAGTILSKTTIYKKSSNYKGKGILLSILLLACSNSLWNQASPIYHRRLEKEADIMGMQFLDNDPVVIKSLCTLLSNRPNDRNHPLANERIAYLKALIAS